jgi:copper chaperone
MFGKKENKLTLTVQGMTCHHCEMAVENAAKEVENILSAKADREKEILEISYKNEVDLAKLKNKIIENGFKVS